MLQRHQLEALDGVALRGELLGALLGQHPVVGWTVHCCVLSAKKMKKIINSSKTACNTLSGFHSVTG